MSEETENKTNELRHIYLSAWELYVREKPYNGPRRGEVKLTQRNGNSDTTYNHPIAVHLPMKADWFMYANNDRRFRLLP